jgi:UDP-2,3-diacylglucosamine pyrophosphatase LpxH
LLDQTSAEHTLILSDIHLTEPELASPKKHPLWKLFKTEKFFVDQSFAQFIEHMSLIIQGPIELIFNGDIFDFDSTMSLPQEASFPISSLEQARGLNSEEEKSAFKIKVILESHPVWVKTLKAFIEKGHRVIFIIGNHDLELHWQQVQKEILQYISVDEEAKNRVRFCEWFYISNQDTLIEHGNQYDAFCLCFNPIHPIIKKGSRNMIRLPFGNLAARYMINGVGVFNPHASSFIQENFYEYIKYYYKYIMRIQPFLIWTWLWGAFMTLFVCLTEALLPAVKDPLTVSQRIESIAKRANATEMMVVLLKEIHAHPAIFNPIKILRELWLDRVILLLAIFWSSFEFFSLIHSFINISMWWTAGFFFLLMPFLFFYSRSITSEVFTTQEAAYDNAPLTAKIAGVKRIIQGHTHLERHIQIKDVEIINTGTWSPAFLDLACTQSFGKKCFAWIRPDPMSPTRKANLFEWTGSEMKPLKKTIIN